MELMTKANLCEISNEEMLTVDGGCVSIEISGEDILNFVQMLGEAAHDAFGCFKCGFHFF